MLRRTTILATLAVALILGFIGHGFAQAPSQHLTIEADRLSEGIARVTYVLVHSEPGQEYGEFPGNGLGMFDEIISTRAFEVNTQQELPTELVPAQSPTVEGLQAVRFDFPNPVPLGGNYRTEVTIEGVANFIARDSAGRWEFSYGTGWNEVFFVLPLGHAIVYASEPILVYERAGSTVAQVRRAGSSPFGDRRYIIFKTRTDF